MLKKTITVFFSLFFCLPVISFAYESIEIKNGGNIEGIVEFAGDSIPQDKNTTSSIDAKYCGKERHKGKYLIREDRRIKNVVVFIKEIKAGKAMPEEGATLTASECDFVPRISVGFKGNKFIVKNEDSLFHTIHVYTSVNGKTKFNRALPQKGSIVTETLKEAGIMELNCDPHPWMLSYVYVFDHPYAAVTDENGEFAINDIPPGEYTIGAWHEALGEVKTATVKVESGGINKIQLRYTQETRLIKQ